MTRILFVTFIVVLSLSSRANDLKFNTQVPKEVQLLLSELYTNKKIHDKDLKTINQFLSLNHSDLTFIRDIIYKFTFSYTKSMGKKYRIINQEMYNNSSKDLQKINISRTFSKFIYDSLLYDLQQLLSSPLLNGYSVYIKNRVQIIPPEFVVFSKKIAYVSPWIRSLHDLDKQQLDNQLDIFTSELLQHIMKILNFTKSSNPSSTKKQYVWLLDKDLETMREQVNKLTFKVSPQPFNSYKAPKSLPKEVSDWVPVDDQIIEDGYPLTNDRLFPEPDPSYNPPKVLPKPVDDWK